MLIPKDTIDTTQELTHLIYGVTRGSIAYAVAELFQSFENSKRVLVITPNDEYAEQLEEALSFFSQYLNTSPKILCGHSPSSPYHHLLPSPRERWQRLNIIRQIHSFDDSNGILIIPIQALLAQQISQSEWRSLTNSASIGQVIAPQMLADQLSAAGYERRDRVEDPGTFSIRGGIIDIFPPTQKNPVRLEFFDTELESIRHFNPDTQRSESEKLDKIILEPAREFNCSPAALQESRERVKEYCDENGIPKAKRDHLSELLARGIAPLELDHLFPFMRAENEPLWKHLPQNTHWVFVEPQLCQESADAMVTTLETEYHSARARQEIVPPASKLIFPWANLATHLADQPQTWLAQIDSFQKLNQKSKTAQLAETILLGSHDSKMWNQLGDQIKSWLDIGFSVNFVANSETQLDRFGFFLHQRKINFLRDTNQSQTVTLCLGNIFQSFALPNQKIVFLSEDDIFGHRQHSKRKNQARHESYRQDLPQLKSLDHLQVDDWVVHLQHGIGIYKGLVTLKTAGVSGDFVIIEYANKDKLYLPIYRLDLLQKYVGAGGSPSGPDRLGTEQFQKAKDRVKAAVGDIAADLLRLYAQRSSLKGYSFSQPDENYHSFAAAFPYDETPDQEKAIAETIQDMCSPRPMDRLVCGDVGFGKTEVAMRAAMKAVCDHKQVAVLVPTTVLAEQHFQNFSRRFRDYPVRIASLSRFRSRKEQQTILEQLVAGKIDIVIGTHRLLSKDVVFQDLGLMVVDEEQRFGVEHKERLKHFKLNTDVLTLTATPIPRTLHMALMGLRDISLIQTPPSDRLPVRTHLSPFDLDVIKTAVEAELHRGGQVFFLHNRVQSIDTIYASLHQLMPQVKIGIAHGQLSEKELERVMLAFFQQEYDVLLCTAIIENGLDVQNANTIIIDRADTFGLSQLYQLRGRVGRSKARAFAYLLVPESGKITDEARERLQLLQRFVDLGSGYAIASHDLEMRGGGDLLGAAQSGHVALVGYDLYLELLQEELSRLKGEVKERALDIEINTSFPAFIPETYIGDMKARLSHYKRLSEYQTEEQLKEAKEELRDRYGPLPNETEELFALLRLKLLLRRIGMRAIVVNSKGFTLTAGPDPKISHQELLDRVAKDGSRYSFTGDGKLVVRHPIVNIMDSIYALRKYLPGLSA